MLDQLDAANFVLVICTGPYYRRFRGHEEPGKGKGGDWEGALITQEIYDSRSRTLKFVPVLFSPEDQKFIPEPLRSINYFALTSEAEYQALYDSLLEQGGVEPGPIGKVKARSRRKGNPLTFKAETASSGASPTPPKNRKSSRKRKASEQTTDAIDSYRRAISLLSDGDYDGALDAFNQSIDLDSTIALAFYNRGLTHYFKHEDDLAIDDFDKSLELGFGDAILFRNRAN